MIANDKCFCSDVQCRAQTPKYEACEDQEHIMSNEGSGADVSIPSFLMRKLEADRIKAELMANRPVLIEMSWNVPIPDGRVEIDIWTTPSNMLSIAFFRSFKMIAEALGDRAHFTPHMYLYDGLRSQCQGKYNEESRCKNLCTNNGRYCSTNPGNVLQNFVSGADVVRESLRRLCIWSTYGAEDDLGMIWWDYVSLFNVRCAAYPANFTGQKCIQDVYQAAKSDGKLIANCMQDSGGTTTDGPNVKLIAEILTQHQRGIVIVPSVFVDTAYIHGALNVKNVLSAICSRYSDGSVPDICRQCAGCSDTVNCVKNGVCFANSTKSEDIGAGMSTLFVLVSILFIIIFLMVVGSLHHKTVWPGTGALFNQIGAHMRTMKAQVRCRFVTALRLKRTETD